MSMHKIVSSGLNLNFYEIISEFSVHNDFPVKNLN